VRGGAPGSHLSAAAKRKLQRAYKKRILMIQESMMLPQLNDALQAELREFTSRGMALLGGHADIVGGDARDGNSSAARVRRQPSIVEAVRDDGLHRFSQSTVHGKLVHECRLWAQEEEMSGPGLAPAPAARTPAPPAVPAQSPSSSSSCGSGSASSSSSSDEEEEEPSDSELTDGQFDEVHFIEQRQGIFSFWQSPQKIKLRFRYADDAAHRAAAFGRKHKFSASQTTDICNFILACQQRAATSTVGGDASGSGVAAAAAHGRDGEAAARSSGDAPEEVVSEVLVLEDVMNENEEGGGAENFFVLPFKGLELRYGLSEDPFVAARKFVKENALAQQDLELISEQLFAWRQQALRG
jgi:hypothetical protein